MQGKSDLAESKREVAAVNQPQVSHTLVASGDDLLPLRFLIGTRMSSEVSGCWLSSVMWRKLDSMKVPWTTLKKTIPIQCTYTLGEVPYSSKPLQYSSASLHLDMACRHPSGTHNSHLMLFSLCDS